MKFLTILLEILLRKSVYGVTVTITLPVLCPVFSENESDSTQLLRLKSATLRRYYERKEHTHANTQISTKIHLFFLVLLHDVHVYMLLRLLFLAIMFHRSHLQITVKLIRDWLHSLRFLTEISPKTRVQQYTRTE